MTILFDEVLCARKHSGAGLESVYVFVDNFGFL